MYYGYYESPIGKIKIADLIYELRKIKQNADYKNVKTIGLDLSNKDNCIKLYEQLKKEAAIAFDKMCADAKKEGLILYGGCLR